MKHFYLLAFVVSVCGCNTAEPELLIPEESIPVYYTHKSVYQVKEIGWTIHVPAGWEILPQEKIGAAINNRNVLYKKSLDVILNNEPDNLLFIRKKTGISLYAKMNQYKIVTQGSYDDYIIKFHQSVKALHQANNTRADYEIGAMRIGGIMFDRFKVKIFTPGIDGGKIHQSYFMGLVNGIDFSMTITWSDEADEDTLLDIIKTSAFSIQ